jgi:hypothetical protein
MFEGESEQAGLADNLRAAVAFLNFVNRQTAIFIDIQLPFRLDNYFRTKQL